MTYFLLHIAINILLLVYKNDLRDQILSLDLLFPVATYLIMALATWLFLITGRRPGYVSFDRRFKGELIRENDDFGVYNGGEGFEIILEKNVQIQFDEEDDEEEEKTINDDGIMDT